MSYYEWDEDKMDYNPTPDYDWVWYIIAITAGLGIAIWLTNLLIS